MRVVGLDPSCLNRFYTHCLSEALVGQGCDVDVVMSEFLYLDQTSQGSYRQWHHFYECTNRLYRRRPRGFLRNYVKGVEHIFDMGSLPSFLKTLEPDVIHFQQAPLPLVDRWFIRRLRKIAPVVSTVHNTTPFHGEHRIREMGFFPFLSEFDHLIVHTEYSREHLLRVLGDSAPPITVIPGGMYDHYENLADPETVEAVAPEEQNILFFGNISHYKGLDVLIRAFAELPSEQVQRSRLLIYGNPQIDMAPVEALATELGIQSRIDWNLRFIPEQEIHGIFQRSTVIALPYRHIDRSGVFATVVKYGLPVVASRIGAFPEMIQDGVHGYLVEPEDPSALAAGLSLVLADPGSRHKMGSRVRALADDWPSWESIAERTVGLYESLGVATHGRERTARPRNSTVKENSLRVVVLDPSCTTWTYTHYLCEALVNQGHEVFLVASKFL